MRKYLIIGLILLVALAVLAGCGKKAETTTSAAPATSETTAVTTATSETTATTAGGIGAVTLPAGVTPISPAVDVTIAIDNAPGMAALVLADKLGYFQAVGINPKWVTFNSGADMITALGTAHVDVGRAVLTASTFNAAAQGIKIWVVADAGQNVPDKAFFNVVVRKGLADKVKDYKDLKGLKGLIASKGSINELFLVKALAKGGLTEKDIKLNVIDSFPDLNTALGNSAADFAVQIEPLIQQGVDSGILVRFPKDASDYAPNEEIAPILYSDAFKAKKDVATKFMIAYLLGARAYNDAIVQGTKDQANIITILTKATFVTDASMWTKMNPTGVNPDGTVDPAAVASDQDFYAGEGLVKQKVDVNTQVVDPSFAQAAVQALGPYTPAK